MKRRGFQIGPGAASLMLIVVVLSMSVLGILTLINARSDVQLSARSVEIAEEIYQLDEKAEKSLAALDEALLVLAGETRDEAEYLSLLPERLPEGMTLVGSTVYWQEQGNGTKSMTCAAEIAPLGAFPRCRFVEHRLLSGIDNEQEGAESGGWD